MKLKALFTTSSIYSTETVKLLRLSIPISINRSSSQIAVTILIALLGLSNTEDLASFSLAISFMAILFSFSSIIVVGVQNLSAKSYGNESEYLVSIFRSGLLISFLVGCILFLVSRIGINPFYALGEDGNLPRNSYEIYVLLSISLPITSMASCCGFYLEGTGRAKFTSIVTAVIAFTKIVLACILILDPFSLQIGAAEGAAVSIILSDCLTLIIFITYIINKDKLISYNLLTIKKKDIKTINLILKIGTPSALGFCLQKLAFSIVALIIASFGESYIAAYTIIFNIISLFAIPIIGLAHSNSILASTSIGSSNKKETTKLYFESLKLTALYALLFSITYIIFRQPISSIFSSDISVLNLVSDSATGTILFFIGHSFFSVPISYLRSFSDTLIPQSIAIFSLYIIAIPALISYSLIPASPNLNFVTLILGTVLILLFSILHNRSQKLCNSYFSPMVATY